MELLVYWVLILGQDRIVPYPFPRICTSIIYLNRRASGTLLNILPQVGQVELIPAKNGFKAPSKNYETISGPHYEITRNYFMEGRNSCVELCARRDSNPEPSDP
jgi:hypothetical protein